MQIVYGVFGVLAILLIIQIRYVIIALRSYPKNNPDILRRKQYSNDILEHSRKTIQAVESGEIKKQLIENDAPLYNSAEALRQYEDFVDNSVIYKKILNLKGNRYNG